MKAKTKFKKMYYKLPKKARKELVMNDCEKAPVSLNVIWVEVGCETELGKKYLKQLGFKDDKEEAELKWWKW